MSPHYQRDLHEWIRIDSALRSQDVIWKSHKERRMKLKNWIKTEFSSQDFFRSVICVIPFKKSIFNSFSKHSMEQFLDQFFIWNLKFENETYEKKNHFWLTWESRVFLFESLRNPIKQTRFFFSDFFFESRYSRINFHFIVEKEQFQLRGDVFWRMNQETNNLLNLEKSSHVR